ncbi:MAG: hypothetical protein AAGA77_04555 [Bacteroidota bacterium]
MKTKLKLIAVLLLISIITYGQDDSTSVSKQIGITGLPIYYISGGLNGNGFNGWALYGNYGWIFNQKNAIGLRPFWGSVNIGFFDDERLHSLGSNIYYRRYLSQDRWSFFVDANIGFGYIWYTSDVINNISENNGVMFNYAFGPGLNYEIKNNWNIEFLIQYLQMRNISNPEGTTIGNTIIPSIGIQKLF